MYEIINVLFFFVVFILNIYFIWKEVEFEVFMILGDDIYKFVDEMLKRFFLIGNFVLVLEIFIFVGDFVLSILVNLMSLVLILKGVILILSFGLFLDFFLFFCIMIKLLDNMKGDFVLEVVR